MRSLARVRRMKAITLRGIDEPVPETVVDILVRQYPLDTDAALSRLVERPEDVPLHRVIDIGVVIEDHRGVASQFQGDLLLSRDPLEVPADVGRSSETEQFEAVVGNDRLGGRSPARENGERSNGKVCLGQNLTDYQGSDRR